MNRTLPGLTLAALFAVGVPTASGGPRVVDAQWGSSRQHVERFYEDGYRSGIREGERDARSRRPPDYRRHDEYRRGNASNGWGWGNGAGGRGAEDLFRRGFVEGYMQGYDRHRASATYGRPGYPDYGGGYGYPGNGAGGYRYSPAAQRGFEDGYRDGRDDARDRDRYEPTRKRNYREGDEGYSSRFGNREQYKYEYRQAFQQGYDRGYREGRYRSD